MESPSTLDYVKTIVEGMAASQEATREDLKEWKDEMRQALRDNREEHQSLFNRIDKCESWQDTWNGVKAGSEWTTGKIVGIVMLVSSSVMGAWYLISIIMHKW